MARKIQTVDKKKAKKKEPSLKPVAAWLFTCAFMVFAMAVIGAITRLTESGLSIVEWKPIAGALPPMNEADWQEAFTAYKASPQYKIVNYGMELAAFKNIFFWEWLHRLWGRLIGVVFALPLLYFWRRIPTAYRASCVFTLALGGVQGAIGFWMVRSGLVKDPAVSPYRLALHLMTAALIYALLLRLALSIGMRKAQDAAKLTGVKKLTLVTLGMAVATMTWGAFTAGLDAGMVYNDTFPYMGAHLWPSELFDVKPVWKAVLTEQASVQFTHRVLAVLTFGHIMLLIAKAMPFNPPPRLRNILLALGVMACLQVAMGVATVLSHVDVHVAAAHQAGAFAILTLLVWLAHEIPVIRQGKA